MKSAFQPFFILLGAHRDPFNAPRGLLDPTLETSVPQTNLGRVEKSFLLAWPSWNNGKETHMRIVSSSIGGAIASQGL